MNMLNAFRMDPSVQMIKLKSQNVTLPLALIVYCLACGPAGITHGLRRGLQTKQKLKVLFLFGIVPQSGKGFDKEIGMESDLLLMSRAGACKSDKAPTDEQRVVGSHGHCRHSSRRFRFDEIHGTAKRISDVLEKQGKFFYFLKLESNKQSREASYSNVSVFFNTLFGRRFLGFLSFGLNCSYKRGTCKHRKANKVRGQSGYEYRAIECEIADKTTIHGALIQVSTRAPFEAEYNLAL
ncbi:hypothetical protein HUJ04_001062 [Dendroctonus ponderosae]|nr:hypothetical protein HUJ04_001062 [Dendroctonus ponderosae]